MRRRSTSALGRVWAWVRLAAASLRLPRQAAPSARVVREQRLIAGALSGGDATVARARREERERQLEELARKAEQARRRGRRGAR